jgi:hypothetical protein
MFKPDQYAQIAKSYADAAADPFVSEGKRQEFAKRADWFHYLATREKGSLGSEPSPQGLCSTTETILRAIPNDALACGGSSLPSRHATVYERH